MMKPWQFFRLAITLILASIFATQPILAEQIHVVSPSDLQQETINCAEARKANTETLGNFLSSPRAEKAVKAAHMDSQRVKAAVSSLSDEDLAQLASRAGKTQIDFAAGRLTDRDLLLILLGIAALVLIIVAVD
jgi:hypothetical protein